MIKGITGFFGIRPTRLINIIRRSSLKVSILSLLLIITVVAIKALSNQEKPILQEITPHEYRPSRLFLPEKGCIPDEETAMHIAEVVWLSVYGNSIYEKKPFRVELLGDSLWVVVGSLPANMLGGVPYIEIQKKDCKILGIGHGK